MDRLRTIQRDFKAHAKGPARTPRIAHHHLLTLAGVMLGVGIMVGYAPLNAEATKGDTVSLLEPQAPASGAPEFIRPQDRNDASAPETTEVVARDSAADQGPDQHPAQNWRTDTVRPGDSMARIFSRQGFSPRALHDIMSLGSESRPLTRIHPGQEIRFLVDDSDNLEVLAYDLSPTRTLEVRQNGDGFEARTIEREVERRLAQASATINDSLFLSASRAGLSDNLTMALAGIFGWDIDFALNIRKGDRFSVIYEELYLDGEKLRDGRILAAEFVNRGRSHRAIYYTDDDNRADYYSPNGDSMRKAFLRTPLDFTRVSSRFNMNRRHPILNTTRPHRGVDYAAPTGTPVKVAGDGRVVKRGTDGGYGKTVVVQHGSRYSTLYAHLNGYARGLRVGQQVKQGQVIGYVGMTGMATGPHLHYEFLVDGVHRNPLTVKLPDASPLAATYMDDFKSHARPLLTQLDVIDNMYASLPEQDGAKILEAEPVALLLAQ